MKTFAASMALVLALGGTAAADAPISSGNIFHETFDNFPEDARSTFIGDAAVLENGAARINTIPETEGVFRVAPLPEGGTYPDEFIVEYDWTLQAPSGDNFYMFYAQQAVAPYYTAIALRTFVDAPGTWAFQVDYGEEPFYEQFFGMSFDQTYHVTIHVQPGPTKPVDLYIDGILYGTYASRNPHLTTDLIQWGDPSSGVGFGDAILDSISIGGIPGDDPIPGDFDGNDYVDGDDLAKWKVDFGSGNGSDADGDGDSDGNDFLIWQRQLGQGTPPIVTAVPEPATGLLALLAILGGCRFALRESDRK